MLVSWILLLCVIKICGTKPGGNQDAMEHSVLLGKSPTTAVAAFIPPTIIIKGKQTSHKELGEHVQAAAQATSAERSAATISHQKRSLAKVLNPPRNTSLMPTKPHTRVVQTSVSESPVPVSPSKSSLFPRTQDSSEEEPKTTTGNVPSPYEPDGFAGMSADSNLSINVACSNYSSMIG